MQYRHGKKAEKLTELALLYGKAKRRPFNTATTPCDSFAAVFTFDDVMPPADRCSICGLYFWWFRRDALAAVTTKNTRMSYRSANTKRLKDQLQEQFNVQIERLMFCKAIRHYLCLRCTILHYAEPFHATLHHLCVHCTIRHYAEPFHATLHRLCTVLQMSARLFAIELIRFTILCCNSTWATRPFIIWLNYPCLECSVSRRKTRPSMPFLY